MIKKTMLGWAGTAVLALNLLMPLSASAASGPGLSLQVSPSPLVLSVKPGEQKTVEVKIYNSGSSTENLKIALQSIKVDPTNSRAILDPASPVEVASWVTFANPTFSIKPAERFSEKININTPPSAGFNYNFALVISRQVQPKAETGETPVVGSLAIFTLLDINRPGATRKLTIATLKSEHRIYEYLPANLQLKLRNDGNTLLLPAGNVFIQRKADSAAPVSVLPVNPKGLYLLPGVTREYNVAWNDGLPHYVSSQVAANTAPQRHLEWNWRNSHFRIGKYVAKVVSVYNDGQRDVPVESQVSFWVIPWKLLLGGLFAVIVLLIGLAAIIRSSARAVNRNSSKYRAK